MELDFTRLSLNELRTLARANQVKGIARLRKQELIDILEEALRHGDLIPNEPAIPEPKQSVWAEPIPESVSGPDRTATDPGSPAANEAVSAPPEPDQQMAAFAGTGPANAEQPGSIPEKPFRPVPVADRDHGEEKVFPPDTIEVSGILEIMDQNSFGFLRGANNQSTPDDIYVSPTQIRRFRLKTGDEVAGKTRPAREGEKFKALFYVDSVNGDPPGSAITRREFDSLTPIYANERLLLEVAGRNDMATRMMDIISPVGKGQRGLIVAPPKAGKTTILKKLAQHIHLNNPEVILIVLLIDERPEEVTDMRESIDGEVISSTFDEEPMNHIKVAEMVLERARRLVEHKKDVVILLDSLTRLARAYNLTVTPSGRTLSGGLDPAALVMPKKFFGAARNIRGGGSLTILATALVETGSRMDEMIYEEFKGTGNMEVHLDRRLQERRIFPAIDIYRSGTRKEELIMTPSELTAVRKIRGLLYRNADIGRVTGEMISLLENSESNEEFVDALNKLEV